ncbi:MAG: hypothetical protein ACFCA4_11590 [Cyanophyceae cyanobacterium]
MVMVNSITRIRSLIHGDSALRGASDLLYKLALKEQKKIKSKMLLTHPSTRSLSSVEKESFSEKTVSNWTEFYADENKNEKDTANVDIFKTGDIYKVEVVSGSFDELSSQIQKNPWWGDGAQASEMAEAWGKALWEKNGVLMGSADPDLYVFATQESGGYVGFLGTFAGQTMVRDSVRKNDTESYVIATLIGRQEFNNRSLKTF